MTETPSWMDDLFDDTVHEYEGPLTIEAVDGAVVMRTERWAVSMEPAQAHCKGWELAEAAQEALEFEDDEAEASEDD